MEKARIFAFSLAVAGVTGSAFAAPQSAASAAPAATTKPAGAPALPAGVTAPAGFVLGPDDQLAIIYWREKDMSAETVVVRPDGMISLPLLNEVKAAGLTVEELRTAITKGASKFVEEPTVSVVVKAINSRKVFITGSVAKPGPYPLAGPTTVLMLITNAGGLSEYANKKKIVVIRKGENGGRDTTLPFNYEDVMKGKNLAQNIELKPNDSVIVPD